MGMTEKQSLINSLSIMFAEDYNLPLKEVKAKVTEITQQYHITINDEYFIEGDLSTKALMSKFKEGKMAVCMSLGTIRQYEIAVAKLEEYTKKRLSDVEPEDINRFLRDYGKTVSTVTLKAKYQLLSSVYNYLFSHKYIPYNPILYIDCPKATVVYKNPMTDTDVEKLKCVCERMSEKESVRNTAIMYTFLSTGCRVNELANIKLKDIDLENKICKVTGKGRKERPVVIDNKAAVRIKLYLDTRKDLSPEAPLFAHIRGKELPMSKDGIINIVKKIRNIANLPEVTCHSFRRYNATELRKRNVNIQMIANYLGHADLKQINRYSLYNATEMLNTIRSAQ